MNKRLRRFLPLLLVLADLAGVGSGTQVVSPASAQPATPQPATPQPATPQPATPQPATTVSDDAVAAAWQDLDLNFAGSPTMRARFRINGKILVLQLAAPGAARPGAVSLKPGDVKPGDQSEVPSTGIREMALRRTDPNSGQQLAGTWQVFHATQDKKQAVQFHGDQLTFSGKSIEVHEHQSDLRYAGTFRLPGKTASSKQPMNSPADWLEGTLDAVIQKNDAGEVTSLSLLGEAGKAAIFDRASEIADRIRRLPALESLIIADYHFPKPQQDLMFLRDLSTLQKLDLRKTNVNDAALVHLKHLKKLQILKLEFSAGLTDRIADYFPDLTALKELDLAYVPVGDSLLNQIHLLPNLEKLYLYGSQITDAGLADLPPLQKLTVLFLGSDDGSAITDASIQKLHQLSALKTLGIPGTRISVAGLNEFRKLKPNCQIIGADNLMTTRNMSEDLSTTGVCKGTLTLKSDELLLKHAFAWETQEEDAPVIHLLLTEEPVDLQQLHESYQRYGADYTFVPFHNQLRLRMQLDGTVESLHAVVNGRSLDHSGDIVESKLVMQNGSVTGRLKIAEQSSEETPALKLDASFATETLRLSSPGKKIQAE